MKTLLEQRYNFSREIFYRCAFISSYDKFSSVEQRNTKFLNMKSGKHQAPGWCLMDCINYHRLAECNFHLPDFLIRILTRFLSRNSRFFGRSKTFQDLIKKFKRCQDFVGKSKILFLVCCQTVDMLQHFITLKV